MIKYNNFLNEYNHFNKKFEVGDEVKIVNCPNCGDWSNKTATITEIEGDRIWLRRHYDNERGCTSNLEYLQIINNSKVGEMVKVINNNPDVGQYGNNFIGKIGRIKLISHGNPPIGVEFYEKIRGGHTLKGNCENGYGYFFYKENLELLEEEDDSQFEEDFELDESKLFEGKFDLSGQFGLGDSFIVSNVDGGDQYGLKGKMGKICFISDKFYGLNFDEEIQNYYGKPVPHCKRNHGIWVFIKSSKYKLDKLEEDDDEEYEKDFEEEVINEDLKTEMYGFKVGDKVKIPTRKTILDKGSNISFYTIKSRYPEKFNLPYWTINKITNLGCCDFVEFEDPWWPLMDLEHYEEVQDDEEYEKDFESANNNYYHIGQRGKLKGLGQGAYWCDGVEVEITNLDSKFVKIKRMDDGREDILCKMESLSRYFEPEEVQEVQDDEEFENDPEVYEEYNYEKDDFEVGDRIRIKKISYYGKMNKEFMDRFIGEIGTIIKRTYRYGYEVDFDNKEINKKGRAFSCDFMKSELELYIDEPDDNEEYEKNFESVNNTKKKNDPAEQAKKDREKYLADIERTANKVIKEMQKPKNSNPNKHIHQLVWKYNKHFSLIKNDVYNKVNQLSK